MLFDPTLGYRRTTPRSPKRAAASSKRQQQAAASTSSGGDGGIAGGESGRPEPADDAPNFDAGSFDLFDGFDGNGGLDQDASFDARDAGFDPSGGD